MCLPSKIDLVLVRPGFPVIYLKFSADIRSLAPRSLRVVGIGCSFA